MLRLLAILAGCALGVGAAFLSGFIASLAVPCGGEQLACSMNRVVGFVGICAYGGAALVVFTAALFWKGTIRAVTIGMLIVLVPSLLAFAFEKLSMISIREFHEIRSNDIQEVLQIVIPAALTVLVPWLFLCVVLRWQAARVLP